MGTKTLSYRLELLPVIPAFHRRARSKKDLSKGQLVYYGPQPLYYGIGEVTRVVAPGGDAPSGMGVVFLELTTTSQRLVTRLGYWDEVRTSVRDRAAIPRRCGPRSRCGPTIVSCCWPLTGW